jgi:hypothetical protein
MAPRYKLKLKRLDFISAVDTPAQETATAVMLKGRAGAAEITARARVVKTSDELGLVFRDREDLRAHHEAERPDDRHQADRRAAREAQGRQLHGREHRRAGRSRGRQARARRQGREGRALHGRGRRPRPQDLHLRRRRVLRRLRHDGRRRPGAQPRHHPRRRRNARHPRGQRAHARARGGPAVARCRRCERDRRRGRARARECSTREIDPSHRRPQGQHHEARRPHRSAARPLPEARLVERDRRRGVPREVGRQRSKRIRSSTRRRAASRSARAPATSP